MSPIRLALVRQKYRPDGGAERFISGALASLATHNLTTHHLQLNIITRQWQGEQQPDWQVHICNPRQWGRVSRERGFARAARQLWQQQGFDLVQSHERIAGCDLYRAGDGVHQRWLQQRARLLPGWKTRLMMAHPFHRYVMQAERDLYTSASLRAVICNAHMIKQQIIDDFAVAADKIHVIYNAVNSDHFTPASPDHVRQLRQHWQLPENASCLIFVGSGFARKGLAAALHAIAASDKHLLVIGKDKHPAAWQALARQLGCQHRVHFMGMRPDTLPFYQMADALLLPTLYDPFPNVILEALACGLPVITSTDCGGKEFIRHGSNGYICDALDIPALQQAIMALPPRAAGTPESLQARESVRQCTNERLSAELIALYQQLLNVPVSASD